MARFLPYWYNDSPLIVEQIQKLLVEYQKLQITIDELLKNVADLDKDISAELQKMYDNGELQTLIDNVCKPYFDTYKDRPKPTQLSMVRKWRKMNICGWNDTFNQNEYYAYAQGCCKLDTGNDILDSNSINVIISGLHTRLKEGTENAQISIIPANQQNPIATTVQPIGHGQSVTSVYSGDYNTDLYICHSSENSITPSNRMSKITYNSQTKTFGTLETKTFEGYIPYMCSHYKKYSFNGIEDIIFVVCGDVIYTLDWDNGTLKELVSTPEVKGTTNGFTVNKHGFWIQADNQIYHYAFNGDLVYMYEIPTVSSDKYTVGEIESLQALSNGEDILIYSMQYCGTTSGVAQRNIIQEFIINPINNNVHISQIGFTRYHGNYVPLYVSGSVEISPTIIDKNNVIINPNGSETSPFMTCMEALDFFSNLDGECLELRLIDTDRTFIQASGYNIVISNMNTGTITQGGIFNEAGNITITANETHLIHIGQTATRQVGAFTVTRGSVLCNYGSIRIYGNVTPMVNASGYTVCEHRGYFQFSTVLLATNFTLSDFYMLGCVTNRTS